MKRTYYLFILALFLLPPLLSPAQWGRIATIEPYSTIAFTGSGMGLQAAGSSRGFHSLRGSFEGDYYLNIYRTEENWSSSSPLSSTFNGPYTFMCGIFDLQSRSEVSVLVSRQTSGFHFSMTQDNWATQTAAGGTTGQSYLNGSLHQDSTLFTSLTEGDSGLVITLTNLAGSTRLSTIPGSFQSGAVTLSAPDAPIVMATNSSGTGHIFHYDPIVQTWQSVYSLINWDMAKIAYHPIRRIQFPTAFIGYVAGPNGSVLKTTDGGTSWISIATGSTSDLTAVEFLNELQGYVGSMDGMIYATTNGGVTWEAQSVTSQSAATPTMITAIGPEEAYGLLSSGEIVQLGKGAGHVNPFEELTENNYFQVDPSKIERVEIFDLLGRRIRASQPGESGHLSLAGLPEGVCVIRFWVNGKPRSTKYRVWQ